MITLSNSEENFTELVFENRHKEYGAYAIRKSYNETVTKSLLITFSIVCLLLAAPSFFSQGAGKPPVLNNGNTPLLPGIPVTIPHDPKPEPKVDVKKNIPEPPKSFTGNVEVSDKKTDFENKPNDQMVIGKTDVTKGADSAAGPEVIKPVEKTPVAITDPNEVKNWVDHMPEFNGNVYQFIKDHMTYPPVAVENGTQGIVALSFVIEKDGSIGDIKVLNSVADGCTQEAIRVVKMMPKWKPGMNGGQPVRVMFNLPIKFRLK